MRAVVLSDSFGLDHLKLTEQAEPRPGPGQVVIEVLAVSLNHRDLRMVEGLYNPKQALPLVVASDAVGRVVELGAGVREPKLGARVCPVFAPGWFDGKPPTDVFSTTLGGPRDGTLREFMTVDADAVVEVPEWLSDEQAACLPCAALTAFSALVTLGKLQAGQRVLCLGTGTVSLFALSFAKALGAHVTITSSSDEKLKRAAALGADALLNYRTTSDWGKLLRTRGCSVDHVIEVGGAATLAQSLSALAPGGTVSLIGVLAGHTAALNLLPIVMRQLRVQGVFVGHRASFRQMVEFMSEHRIEPVVGPVYDITDFSSAFQALADQTHFGKVCVRLA